MNSEKKGKLFREFVSKEIKKEGSLNIKHCWTKLDSNILKNSRLSIAFRERKGGIMRMWGIFQSLEKQYTLWAQGNYSLFYVFILEELRAWYYTEGHKHTHVYPYPPKPPTVEAAYLVFFDKYITCAEELCVGVFDFRWKDVRRDVDGKRYNRIVSRQTRRHSLI